MTIHMFNDWPSIKDAARQSIIDRCLPDEYSTRLDFEIAEIEKQGANAYWVGISNKKYTKNPNNLLLPWLVGMVENDPLVERKDPMLCTIRASDVKRYISEHGSMPSDFIKDQDMPDIDLDCLPDARDPIKEYAISRYNLEGSKEGFGPVCSVGTWQTYKFKSAIIDASRALAAAELQDVYALTTNLPDTTDAMLEGGYATCKGKIVGDNNIETECNFKHNGTVCPKCGSVDTETPTLGQIFAENENLVEFYKKYPKVIDVAANLVGRVSNLGTHSGAIIIADRDLFGSIPLSKSGSSGYWKTLWTEGRNTQLSKFGFCKWDILGLKTLQYVFVCSKLIEQNRGIYFGENVSGWDDIDPTQNRAGHYFDGNGNKCYIDLNDEHALSLANRQLTDAIFQFDTDLAKSILANGVRNFNDLMLLNAMGHPGPMASIPEAMANRDDAKGLWKDKLHPLIYEVLKDTYGVIVYQEQLQAIWQIIAGFTAPEAQEARKAVAKKWTHKLKPIKAKWLEGAGKVLGKEEAETWWTKMETFGRYAFNKSHSVSYCLVALRCLWLKAHFAPEYWAAVMSDCHPDKLPRYMSVARAEEWQPTDITYSGKFKPAKRANGVQFGTLNINRLTSNYTVTGDVVNQGLIGISGIGEKAAATFEGEGEFKSIDHFIYPNLDNDLIQHKIKNGELGKDIDKITGQSEDSNRKVKGTIERLVKLNAFSHLPGHQNMKALWLYYQCHYASDTAIRKQIQKELLLAEGWDDAAILKERQNQIKSYKEIYPKRTKIPAKVEKWQPPTPVITLEKINKLYPDDYSQAEKLEFQKQLLGYYLDSPLELFELRGGYTIKNAISSGVEGEEAMLEVMVTQIDFATTKPKNNSPGSQYAKLTATDGIQSALIFMWNNELSKQDPSNLLPGCGLRMRVKFDKERHTFTVARGTNLIKLRLKDPINA